jgi:hypothetical protein
MQQKLPRAGIVNNRRPLVSRDRAASRRIGGSGISCGKVDVPSNDRPSLT